MHPSFVKSNSPYRSLKDLAQFELELCVPGMQCAYIHNLENNVLPILLDMLDHPDQINFKCILHFFENNQSLLHVNDKGQSAKKSLQKVFKWQKLFCQNGFLSKQQHEVHIHSLMLKFFCSS